MSEKEKWICKECNLECKSPPKVQVLDGIENIDKNTLADLIELMERNSTPAQARNCRRTDSV